MDHIESALAARTTEALDHVRQMREQLKWAEASLRDARAAELAEQVRFPKGWSEDERAPFTTYYSEDGLVGITLDEDGTNLWFPIAFDPEDEDVKPLGDDGSLLDWDTRPTMYPTRQLALNATLAHS